MVPLLGLLLAVYHGIVSVTALYPGRQGQQYVSVRKSAYQWGLLLLCLVLAAWAWLEMGAVAVGVTNTVTTDPWCCPHQSPTNTAPAPVVTAKTQAPVIEAADARAFQVPTVCLPRGSVARMLSLLRHFRVGTDRNVRAGNDSWYVSRRSR